MLTVEGLLPNVAVKELVSAGAPNEGKFVGRLAEGWLISLVGRKPKVKGVDDSADGKLSVDF